MDSGSSSSSSHESRENILQKSPRKSHNFTVRPLLAIAVVSILCAGFAPTESAFPSSSDFDSAYDRHCSRIVPRSPPVSDRLDHISGLPSELKFGYYSGGAPILNQTVGSVTKNIYFTPSDSQGTAAEGVYDVGAMLFLRGSSSSALSDLNNGSWDSRRPNQRLVRFRGPRVRRLRRGMGFDLRGFWSEVSRELCMIGSGTSQRIGKPSSTSVSVVLKLRYPRNSTINGGLVVGSLESLEGSDSDAFFEPVLVLAVVQDSSHEYTLVKKDNSCLSGGDGEESFRVSALPRNGCSVFRGPKMFELEYSGDCNGFDCNPLGKELGFVPSNMVFYRTQCGQEDKKWQMLLGFPNSNYGYYSSSFDPNTTLVAEGEWNEKEDRFCGVACRILNVSGGPFDGAYVGDCSIGFSLRIPTSLSLRNRFNVVGKIWSTKAANSSGHFSEIGINGFERRMMSLLRHKYEYTAINNAGFTIRCAKKNSASGKGKKYPVEYSSDMAFDINVKDSRGINTNGYSTPIFVGNEANKYPYSGFPGFYPQPVKQTEVSVMSNNSHSRLVNISYEISFTVPTGSKLGRDNSLSNEVKVAAEGTYNRDNGVLCMIGCRKVISNIQNSVTNDTLDCEIAVDIQFSPLDAKTRREVKGTIESTRGKSDPLYFERLELSSMSIYSGQAKESIWRMDLEITMVLISKTLTCVFVGLQLFYIKSRPEVLPFASVAMLVVLTIGHMIPLVLNFEALFVSRRERENYFLGSGGWVEANEVIVRIVTMVAFLLQLRLLHLTWTSRKAEASEKNLWGSERKVLYATIPLYVLGALIAWLANHLKNSSGVRNRMTLVVAPFRHRSFQRRYLWEDLKSYAGLVMDGFLLPQILFNLFADSRVGALAPLFYVGTTLVRILPHAYDLYRARTFSPYLDLSYIYASHRMDFFSTAWDIVIPCGGLVFAVLIFLQQRFGGRCVLPGRFRGSSVYEKVPVISNEDL